MKKIILASMAILAIAAAVAFSVNFNTNNYDLSDITLANVDALAQSEGDDGDGYAPFPVCRCGEGYGDYKDGMKMCVNKTCISMYARTGTLNVNYCANCD